MAERGYSLEAAHSNALGAVLLEQQGVLAALLDADLRTLSCTRALSDMFCATPSKSIDLFNALPVTLRDACQRALTGEITNTHRLRIHLPDASRRSLNCVVRPWRANQDGDVVSGVTIVCEDQTAAAKIERQISTAQETLRVAMSAANCGIWRLDVENKEVWVSPEYERIMGTQLSFEDLTSPTPTWMFWEDLPKYAAFLESLSGPDGHANIEHRIAAHPNLWIYATCERVRDAAGKTRFYVGMARNITGSKRSWNSSPRRGALHGSLEVQTRHPPRNFAGPWFVEPLGDPAGS